MPINSKYSNQEVQQLLDAIFSAFEQHQAPVDLQLMVLGDATTNILNGRVSIDSRKKIADRFAQALLQSLHTAQ